MPAKEAIITIRTSLRTAGDIDDPMNMAVRQYWQVWKHNLARIGLR
jgi:hypothetical protein